MVRISSEFELPPTRKALKVVTDMVAGKRSSKNILQRAGTTNQQKAPLIHDLN